MSRRFRALLLCAAVLMPCWAGAAEPKVAILPVVVHSGAGNAGYLSDGLSDMLAARLEQLGSMRVVREEGATKATTRLPQAVERAKALGADYVVFGSFTQFGDGASLDLQCAPVAGPDPEDARTLFIQSGAIGDIIPKLDDLADKIAYYVLGDAGGKAAVASRAGGATPIRDVLRRIEELERSVYGKSAPAPVAAPAAAPTAGSPEEGEEAEESAATDGNGGKAAKPPSGPEQGPKLPPQRPQER